jgi:hypothetical protein
VRCGDHSIVCTRFLLCCGVQEKHLQVTPHIFDFQISARPLVGAWIYCFNCWKLSALPLGYLGVPWDVVYHFRVCLTCLRHIRYCRYICMVHANINSVLLQGLESDGDEDKKAENAKELLWSYVMPSRVYTDGVDVDEGASAQLPSPSCRCTLECLHLCRVPLKQMLFLLWLKSRKLVPLLWHSFFVSTRVFSILPTLLYSSECGELKLSPDWLLMWNKTIFILHRGRSSSSKWP